ncbi:MAG: GH3 auxin-responsive promoter family protein [Planctomycetota bacterium]|jgi:hypothetical protein
MGLLKGLLRFWHQAGTARFVREFQRGLADPRKAQARALRRALSCAASTEYARRHGFSTVGNADDYRRRVPLVHYEDVADLVDRQRRGEPDVLVPGRPEMFARTSGTTGRSKYIPVTRRSYLDYHFAQTVWRNHMLRDHPEVVGRKLLSIVSPAAEEYSAAGIPCGAISGKIYLSQSPGTRMFVPVPYEVMELHDYRAKYYLITRLAAGADVGLIATANAATLVVLAEEMAANAEALANDIERGAVGVDVPLPAGLMDKLWPRLAPDAATAARIRAALEEHGTLRPRDLWPRLELMVVWLGGAAGFFTPRVQRLYSPRFTRDLGFTASEGFFAVPLTDNSPVGAPALTRVFMEFIPEEENGEGQPRTLLAHELEEGGRYFLVITTTGGLFRYRMEDLVEVAGRCGRRGTSPELRFLSKGARILSLAGEKVSEFQASRAASRAVEGSGLDLVGFTVSLRLPGEERPGYVVAVEPRGEAPPGALQSFLESFEAGLRAANIEYRGKRDSLRLSAPVLLILPEGSYRRWRAERVAGGAHDGQIKPPNLLPPDEFNRCFQPRDFVTLAREGRG